MKIFSCALTTFLLLISINTLPAFSSAFNDANALNATLDSTVEQDSARALEIDSLAPMVSGGQALTFGIWKVYNDNDRYLYFLDIYGGRIVELRDDSNGWLIVVTEVNGYFLYSSGDSDSGYDIFGQNLADAEAAEPTGELNDGEFSFGTWVINRFGGELTIMNPTGVVPTQETRLTEDTNGIVHIGRDHTITFDPTYELPNITVRIDLKDDNDSNCLNINGQGTIPATIFGEETLDVNMISQSSLTLAGLAVGIRGNGSPQCSVEKVNADEFYDLVCHFQDDPGNWLPGEGTVSLKGMLYDGTRIAGEDSLCIVP